MTKEEFVQELYALNENDLASKKAARNVVNGVLDLIKEKLKAGETIDFIGFGKFFVTEVPERVAINPQKPGEKITVPAHKAARMKFSKSVNNELNA